MERIQRKRTKGWKMPENTVYVGRPSRWGNPYSIHNMPIWSPYKEVEAYRIWLEAKLKENPHFLDALKGKDLACWCNIGEPCHADVILKKLKKLSEV